MKKIDQLFLLLFVILSINSFAQPNQGEQKATYVVQAKSMKKVPSITERIAKGTFKPAENIVKVYNPKERGVNNAVPGKGLPKGRDPLWNQEKAPLIYKSVEPILTFEATSAYATPTDPTGAVGPNHFVNAWNSSFRIWDKEGNALTSPASLGNIFPGNTMGDPIVMYDQFADRFLITQFYSNGFLVAISQGPDPVNDGWYTYEYPTNSFPDYPKYSVWSDGYYITANKDSNSPETSEVVFALDRDKIIAGDPNAEMIGFSLPGVSTNGFYSPLGFNVTGAEMPPAGNAPIVYMQDDSWVGVNNDQLKIWNVNVDWETPANSTISIPLILDTEPFDGLFDGGSFSNLPQPSGSDIDALQATIMYMAQYRRFDTHNSVVFNFVVDLDGNDDLAGIRWYELRQENDNDLWEIYQEGTYAQPDGHSAFSGNICMDAQGNIALGYTVVSNTQNPSLKYTGRLATDPLGTMTVDEGTIIDGTQVNNSFRYGDYSQMTIDPVDDLTFWSIGEYFAGGARKNHVGVFKLAPNLATDMGVVSIESPQNGSLSTEESIVVTLRNYGSEDQADVPIELFIDGENVASEIVSGTVPAATNIQHTFDVTYDFSEIGIYDVMAYTDLADDMERTNDTLSVQIESLLMNDVGIIDVITPVTDVDLSAYEDVTVLIQNFGASAQSGFDVAYKVNNNEMVVEQVTDAVEVGTEYQYTFAQKADLSAVMEHDFYATTLLENDQDTTNDAFEAVIENQICQPLSNCSNGASIYAIELGDLNNETACNEDGYADYSSLSTNLPRAATHNFILTTEQSLVYLKVWVDMNDNFVFESSEAIIDNSVVQGESIGDVFIDTIPFPLANDANIGEHLMRVKINSTTSVPDDACFGTTYGETEDYALYVDYGVSADEREIEHGKMTVSRTSNNIFTARLKNQSITEPLNLAVHNIQGKTVLYDRIHSVNGVYEYKFNMSYAPKGVYLLRIGNDSYGKVKKIIVQ